MAVLIDTNILVAIGAARDNNHTLARQAMREIKEARIIPAPVLPEMFYLLKERVNYGTAISLFNLVRTAAFIIEPLTAEDMARMEAIMLEYGDNQFDYVDTAIMAISERLNIADIYTFDRRDFTSFRPKHRPYLRLLP